MEKKRNIKYSSQKEFLGSQPTEFYNKEYFMSASGSNYGREGFAPYTAEFYLERNRSMVKSLLEQLPHIKTAMVLGCARGYMVQALHENGVDAVGVDISEWAIENCSKGVEDSVYCGDVCDLSKWDDGVFDLVVAFDVFEHIEMPDLDLALDEAVRVANKQRGMILLDLPINPDDSHPDMSDGTDASHVSVYTKTWWILQFLQRGFEPFGRVWEYVYPNSENKLWEDGKDHAVTIYFRRTLAAPTADSVLFPTIKADSKGFKILWWSNSSTVGTGYGVGTNGVVYPLNEHYDVRVVCNYGLEGRAMGLPRLEGDPVGGLVMHYPRLFGTYGEDACQIVVNNWQPHVLVSLFDVWISEKTDAKVGGGSGWLGKIHPRWIPYVPIDHDPIPEYIARALAPAYKIVAMSQFGQKQIRSTGLESTYIPHGCSTKVFKPTTDRSADFDFMMANSTPMIKDDALPWDEDCFVLGMNAANKDPERKGFGRMFAAAQMFLHSNPDAKKDFRIFLHTWPRFPGGKPLDRLSKILNVAPHIRCTHEYRMYTGLTETNLSRLMGAWDVLYNVSMAEGFGISIIEACAKGIPPIGTRFTSMPELIEGHGWLVEPLTRKWTNLLSLWAVPDEFQAADAIEQAYNNPDKLKDYGEKAREFSLNYDWDNVVVPLWIKLMEEVREDLRPRAAEERRLF